MEKVTVGLCGLGTVGSGTLRVMQRNAGEIRARAGLPIVIGHIGARRDNPACDTGSIRLSRDIFAVAQDPSVDILVEAIGGLEPARELVLAAIANGKHVVTANKALIALHGNEIFQAARERGVTVAFEAAVGGGIPIIKAIREGLAANRIQWLAGIINGTTNFILTEMRDKGRHFNDVLLEAQQRGYAEADPTFDIEGIDAAHKLVILASLAFGIPLQFDKVYTEGIAAVEIQDMQLAEELGYRIKHLGITRRADKGIELRVHPALVPRRRLIANVNGVKNAILVEADALGPSLYYGAGAGAEPTASSVIADIIDVARSLQCPQESRVPYLAFHEEHLGDDDILPMAEVVTAFYLRMLVQDKAGVLSAIARVFSDHGINLDAVLQKEAPDESGPVPLVIVTDRCREGDVDNAVRDIEATEYVLGKVTRLRVESLDG